MFTGVHHVIQRRSETEQKTTRRIERFTDERGGLNSASLLVTRALLLVTRSY